MKNFIKETIADKLDFDFSLEKPKDSSLGHYAVPVFVLSKILKKSPVEIAKELSAKFEGSEVFESVAPINGYINFKLSDKFLNLYATTALKNESEFAKGEKRCEKILLEFVSANPTGPLHIGHARGAVYGDTLCKIGRHVGYEITSEYYINDAGSQVELLGLSLVLSGKQHILKQEVQLPEVFYRGEYINDLALEASKEFGEDIFQDENIAKLASWGKDKMMSLVESNLADANIVFDNFVSEKKMYEKWDESFAKLKQNGSTYEKDSKVWIKSSEFGDEKDRVVVREDGRPTYLAGDIIYHDDKFARNYDKYINIWGADHHGYIARVKAAIHFLGYNEEKLEVLLAQMVSLLKGGEPYKMSKRAGNFILMSDVIEEIGQDALRFIFLSKKCDTHLEFDVDVLKQTDSSNPIYYINYAHARVNQVFQKASKKPSDVLHVELKDLNTDAKDLLFHAMLLPEVLVDAFSSKQVQKLPDYLKALASSLHKFYNENRIVGAKDEDKLLKLFATVALSLRVGLRLMGIEAKDKM